MSELLVAPIARDLLTVAGPDAVSFLHGQLSQDVTGLAVGTSAWSFLLQPSGKVSALVRLHRRADDVVDVDVDAGYGEVVLARLNRFRLRVKLDITEPVSTPMLAWRGAGAVEAAMAAGGDVLVGWWAADDAADGVGVTLPSATESGSVTATDVDTLERLRIEAGWPAMGHELTDDVIPAESGVVAVAVDFRKGCYTGQELTARIDSRGGNVPRRLRRLRLGEAMAVDDLVTFDGKEIGHITSVAGATSGAGTDDVALAYIARAIEPPCDVLVGGRPAHLEDITA